MNELETLKIENLCFQAGGRVLIDDICLSVNQGERLVLMGPSGGGKTIFLKLVAGLISPSSGEVRIKGQDPKPFLSQNKLGMLFQRNALFDSLTAIENLKFPLQEVWGWEEQKSESRAKEFLEKVGLQRTANLYPHEMSGGMQKRLGIARALVLEPEVIFYDDPLAGLDPMTSRQIAASILELATLNKTTIILTTHDRLRARALGTRYAFMMRGKLLTYGSLEKAEADGQTEVSQFLRSRP